jgi:gas vesicle protein
MSNSKVLLAFLGGIAVGAVAGILLAPDKGSNTRNAIKKMAEDLTGAVEDSLHEAFDKVKDKYTDVAEQASDKINDLEKDIKTRFS